MDVKMLPEAFRQRIENQLGEESKAFFLSYEEPPKQGLRVNPLKVSPEKLQEISGFFLSPVPWEPLGFFYDSADAPGKHPLHAAGAYYIQEPSAMAVARLLSSGECDRVLDLSAAPGGKTTHLSSLMKNKGLLIANEIHPNRAKILSENVERCGLKNCIVTNERPERLAARFPGFFTKILVDAPCSGEGMFRKNPEALSEWTKESNAFCAARQKEILSTAEKMLCPGGSLCYSTCTFAEEENEEVIRDFLSSHPDFTLEKEIRLWPHKDPGEGHYAALLKREGQVPRFIPKEEVLSPFEPLCDILKTPEYPKSRLIRFGDTINLLPAFSPSLSGLKVLRAGLCLGKSSKTDAIPLHAARSASGPGRNVQKRGSVHEKRERFLPSHSLALSLSPDEVLRTIDLSVDDARRYLTGLTFPTDGPNGWTLVTVCGLSLGWGKTAGGILKNHYPKGLRLY